MSAEIAASWDKISLDWGNWRPPLKPCLQDIHYLHSALSEWAKGNGKSSAEAILLGVTREIAASSWPIPVRLLSIDASPMMVHRWGFKSDDVKTVVGDWFDMTVPDTRDAVFGDGSFVFYGPERADELRDAIVSTLRPGGLYAGRHFVLPEVREDPQSVYTAVRRRQIMNFGMFKFRLAMALQQSEAEGVLLSDVWQAVQDCGVNFAQAGFPDFVVSTIGHYKDNPGRLYFPSRASLTAAFAAKFSKVEMLVPPYEFGGCCPTLIAVN